MVKEGFKRKLAAVLNADVVGYLIIEHQHKKATLTAKTAFDILVLIVSAHCSFQYIELQHH